MKERQSTLVVFFQIPNYSQNVHNASKNANCNEDIFVIINTN